MGIFDIFTGQPAKDAAAANQGVLQFVDQRGRDDITGAAGDASNYLNAGYGQGRRDLDFGYTTGVGNVNTGADAALGYLGGAAGSLGGLASKYGAASSLGLNALGVNGQQGADAARAAFMNSPAYQFNLQQGLDAINRRRAAGGMLDSGNADRDAQKFGAGLASNEYNNWLSSLLGFTNPELTAAGGAANIARSQAQTEGTRGDMLAQLAQRYGQNVQQNDVGLGAGLAGLTTDAARQRTGLDTALAGPYTQQNTNAAQAQLQGSQNLWGLGLNAAKLAAGSPSFGGFGSWLTADPNQGAARFIGGSTYRPSFWS